MRRVLWIFEKGLKLKRFRTGMVTFCFITFASLLLRFLIKAQKTEYCFEDNCAKKGFEFPICSKEINQSPCFCEKQAGKQEENLKIEKWTQIPPDLPIQVFSAFLDSRDWKQPKNVQKPVNFFTVRIIAHGIQAEYNTVPAVYCSTNFRGRSLNLGQSNYVRIYVSTAHHDEYTAHFILCYLPEVLETAETITLSSAPCGNFHQSVSLKVIYSNPVMAPTPVSENLKLGICVSPVYGYKPLHMAEFIETHRILGIEWFTFYIHKASKELRSLFDYYKNLEIVQLVDWPLDMSKNYFYFDQRSALNDCLYRNYGKVTYAAFMDLDEVLAPRSHHDLPSLISHVIKENKKRASICFQHVYFEKNQSDPTGNYDPPFTTQTKFSRTKEIYPAGKIRSKCFHAPAYMVATDIHSGQWWLNDSMEEYFLPEKLAILQHYRGYKFEKMLKEPDKFEFQNDYFLLRFRPQLTDRVKKILNHLKLPY